VCAVCECAQCIVTSCARARVCVCVVCRCALLFIELLPLLASLGWLAMRPNTLALHVLEQAERLVLGGSASISVIGAVVSIVTSVIIVSTCRPTSLVDMRQRHLVRSRWRFVLVRRRSCHRSSTSRRRLLSLCFSHSPTCRYVACARALHASRVVDVCCALVARTKRAVCVAAVRERVRQRDRHARAISLRAAKVE
jgi:hypothetical protein